MNKWINNTLLKKGDYYAEHKSENVYRSKAKLNKSTTFFIFTIIANSIHIYGTHSVMHNQNERKIATNTSNDESTERD